MKILSLKKREEFLHASKNGNNVATKGLVLQTYPIEKPKDEYIKIGFTVTKRVGNAVIRNRVKRRLRALAREVMTNHASDNFSYVLIGRFSTITRDYIDLKKDLKYALHKTECYINKK